MSETHGEDVVETSVPANVSRHFIVGLYNTNESSGGMELALIPKAVRTRRDVLPPGSYDLTLALTASNTDATFWRTTLTFNGTFSSEEDMRDNLALSSPVQLPAP